MKTMYYLLFTLFLSLNIHAAEDAVFPTSDAIWNIDINGKEYLYGLVGDSIINDTLYHKLYLLKDTIPTMESTDEYVGGFRIEEKQVWFRAVYGDYVNQEILLHDFSKSIGDTVVHNGKMWQLGPIPELVSAEPNYNYASIIGAITEENGNEMFHTSIHNVYDNNEFGGKWMGMYTYTKNIGSLDGLFFFLYQHSMSGRSYSNLVCFKQGNQVLFLDRPECCKICFYSIVVQVPEIPEAQNIHISYENRNIRIDGYSNGESTLFLFNLTGKPVFEKGISFDTGKISLDKNLSTGTYLYHISKENNIIKSGKLIIK